MPDENYVKLVSSYFRPADTFEVKYLRLRLEVVYRKLLPDTERRHQIRPSFLGWSFEQNCGPSHPLPFHVSRRHGSVCMCISMTSLFHRTCKIRLKHRFRPHRKQTVSITETRRLMLCPKSHNHKKQIKYTIWKKCFHCVTKGYI